MLQVVIQFATRAGASLTARWWGVVLCGLAYGLCFPPFSGQTHWLFAPLPLLSLFALVPLLHFATLPRRRTAMGRSYLFGVAAAISQFHWISNVHYENLWPLIMLGLCLVSLYVGLYFLLAAALFRFVHHRIPRFTIILFPALWVLIEYSRTIGELAFPWLHLGYALTQVLPLAQAASVCGVFGLSFLVVMTNTIIFTTAQRWRPGAGISLNGRYLAVAAAVWILISAWGLFRLSGTHHDVPRLRISLLQSSMDQTNWGNGSIDSAFSITESMVEETNRLQQPRLMILPESALLCYLARRSDYRNRVLDWVEATHTPLILGALHWEKPPENSPYEYFPYNAAFFVKPDTRTFDVYYKMRLLPFSEAMPFEASFPILSRVNLGESDFQTGKDPVIFAVNDSVKAGPFICYEMIFPSLIRQRVRLGANLLVNITNDGWFGKSSAAFQHAAMAQMRCIENGVSLARCANSGISTFVDQYGRELGRTKLYERTTLTRDLPTQRIGTIYTRTGDWPVGASAGIAGVGIGWIIVRRARRKKKMANIEYRTPNIQYRSAETGEG